MCKDFIPSSKLHCEHESRKKNKKTKNCKKCVAWHIWTTSGSSDSSVVRTPDSPSQDLGFESRQERRLFFFSRVNLLRWLLLRYPFHLPVTAVVHQKKWIKKQKKQKQLPVTFWQTCRWLVTAKHACTLRMWICMKWRDMVHGCMVYTERAEMAAVSSGTSHVTTKQRCK